MTVRIDGPWIDWISAIDKSATAGGGVRRLYDLEPAPAVPLDSRTVELR